ncbi:malto-oligosyltrehalose trehalohydrolase [Rhodopirellula sp. MGV]|uniref:malto-oligosyltrehalose trehalohydrolase n=1 Tax=Rhodopirellula sp. MGV TaxID=2023130 RepID=UPI000B966A5E|nr:malto-oligosyltrehalose trehalohydrolase [Rhodopirellula sp. MGV]OYP37109.1 malto-oligosyltrehalose trehalohydrolase [Rhodopirellula sp. MGV]PNY34398.1 malto-oligosyltrehalose trehalohydrolase [Rhodopirellula baltica]
MMNVTDRPLTEFHRVLGAQVNSAGTRFCVWAPLAQQVVVDIIGGATGIAMERKSDGYFAAQVDGVTAGATYFYRVDGGPQRPDPASRFQPQGVHGPSQVIDPAFAWTDSDWKGIERDNLVIYEAHTGAFTKDGTFLSAIDRLPELVDLGVTAVEWMPVAASAGRWNWGYDGVSFFAPTEAYGTPDDFRRFVDAAHAAGLAVLLDVVYNHVGPEGNYLNEFGPYFSTKHHTVWGEAPNFDDETHGDEVRKYFIANALYWLDEFHLDGLRVDAIHCMADDRDPHVVAEMSDAVHAWSQSNDRPVLLIAESNVYDPEMLVERSDGGIGFDAMWGDDFLHSVFAVLRPGEQLTHREYLPWVDLAQTVKQGYVYEGTLRSQRGRKALTERVCTHGLVYSIQNHDFIGNHPLGERLHRLTSHDAHRAAAALMILSPAIPMLFMGEEFACEAPFCFFVDFGDDQLRQGVIEGRRRDYPQHNWDAGVLPTDPEAFTSAKIGDRASGNAETLDWYRQLVRLRTKTRESGLLSDENLTVTVDQDTRCLVLRYANDSQVMTMAVRFSADTDDGAPVERVLEGNVVANSKGGEYGGMLHANHAVVTLS